MPKSSYGKQLMLNYLFKIGSAITRPTSLYLALFQTSPTDSNNGTEVNYENYIRQQISFGEISTTSGTPGSSSIRNASDITFAAVPIGVVAGLTVGHVGIMTAESGGNLLYYGSLSASYALNAGVQPIVKTGALTISET